MKLTYSKRLIIESELRKGTKVSHIANMIGVHRNSIYDEIKRSRMTKDTYDARKAQLMMGETDD